MEENKLEEEIILILDRLYEGRNSCDNVEEYNKAIQATIHLYRVAASNYSFYYPVSTTHIKNPFPEKPTPVTCDDSKSATLEFDRKYYALGDDITIYGKTKSKIK